MTNRGRPYSEPARSAPIKWLTYESRYLLGIALMAGGYGLSIILMLGINNANEDRLAFGAAVSIPILTTVVSAIVLPGRYESRMLFAMVALSGSIVFLLPPQIMNVPKTLSALLYAIGGALVAWAWLILRQRRAKSHLLVLAGLVVAFLVSSTLTNFISPYGGLNPGYPELFDNSSDLDYADALRQDATVWVLHMAVAAVVVVGVSWLARRVSAKMKYVDPALKRQERAESLARVAENQERAAQDARVEEIKKWEAAYAQAHDGQAPPAGYAPPIVVQTNSVGAQGANTLALLSLIFGLLGGWLGIIFGVVALAQIKRTGQSGRGMAVAGIVAAIVWIVISLVVIIIVSTAAQA